MERYNFLNVEKKWRKNKYYGMTDDEIKAVWEKNRDDADTAGTAMHLNNEIFCVFLNSFDDLITDTTNKINDIKAEIDSIKKVINLMDVVKFVVSEEGVKSFIVKKILSHFNGKLTHFLKKLDSNCICAFNEYFEEEIINEKGKICLYNNFSGAERKAIDLACLFSFMDMRKSQGDVYYNISF